MNQLYCPRCKNEVLSSGSLEKGLATECCKKCQGHWVLVEHFVFWKENHSANFLEKNRVNDEIVEQGRANNVSIENNSEQKKVLLCPSTGKMMQRFFIHHTIENRLNFSNTLSGIWLDGGDWQLLKSLNIATDLNRIFTTNWQNNVRQQQLEISLEQRYCEKLGADDFHKLKEFREWLYTHSEKEIMLAYVTNGHQ